MSKDNSNNIKVEEMLPEYNFDYSKAKPNRFAQKLAEQDTVITILLDPDVAKIFKTSDEVNAVLRALIQTMPKTTKETS